MASVVQLPKFKAWVPVTGVPAASYALRTYAAGTTTNQAVFTDSACTIPAANPVILDANGEAILYAVAGTLYKFSLYDPTNTTQQSGWPVDNVSIYGTGGGGGGGGGGSTGSEWIASGFTPAFINGTSFSFPLAAGNLTTTYTPGRRLQTTNTGGVLYSTVVSSTFTTVTNVTVVNDSGNLDSGLSVVNLGILNPANPSSPLPSIVNVGFVHNAETYSTGTPKTLNSANGFTVGNGAGGGAPISNYGEWSSSTGLFTATRGGMYLWTLAANCNSFGVTFNGTSTIALSAGSFSPTAIAELCPSVTGSSVVFGSITGTAFLTAGQTLGAQITFTYSAGSPNLLNGWLNIYGPLFL